MPVATWYARHVEDPEIGEMSQTVPPEVAAYRTLYGLAPWGCWRDG